MNEKRLLEIASTIDKLDGPNIIFGYLTSLRESDMHLFLNCVKGSKYSDLNIYDAIKSFCLDYVNGKEELENNHSLEELGYNPKLCEFLDNNYIFNGDYFETLTSVDDSVKIVNSGRKK